MRVRIVLFFLIFSSSFLSAQGEDGRIGFFGTVKSRFEYSPEESLHRFSVRNSRFGFKGSIVEGLSYQTQIDLSANGDFSILDLYGKLRIFNGFDITLGQNAIPFYNGYTVTPSVLLFANRPFIGKYFTGTRDIGAKVEYRLPLSTPLTVEAGLYNSGVINDPQWSNKISYAGRISYGLMEGFRATAKVYRYDKSTNADLFLWGADLRYKARRWVIESEFVNMYNYYDKTDLSSYYVQSIYSFPLADSKLFHAINPALRWDSMGYDALNSGFEVNRFTLSIGLALNSKIFDSVLRLDYERYFLDEERLYMPLYADSFSDKLTLELLINF